MRPKGLPSSHKAPGTRPAPSPPPPPPPPALPLAHPPALPRSQALHLLPPSQGIAPQVNELQARQPGRLQASGALEPVVGKAEVLEAGEGGGRGGGGRKGGPGGRRRQDGCARGRGR